MVNAVSEIEEHIAVNSTVSDAVITYLQGSGSQEYMDVRQESKKSLSYAYRLMTTNRTKPPKSDGYNGCSGWQLTLLKRLPEGEF